MKSKPIRLTFSLFSNVLICLFFTVTVAQPSVGATHRVDNSSDLKKAIASAVDGDVIEVAGPSIRLKIVDKKADKSNRITVRSAKLLGTSVSSVEINNCSGIVLEGFRFPPSSASTLVKVVNSKGITISRNFFDHKDVKKSQSTIVTTQACDEIEIAYNTFTNKNVGNKSSGDKLSGSYIKTQWDEPNITKNLHIHHNYFQGIAHSVDPNSSSGKPYGDSDREAIVFGVSDSQDIETNHLVEYNLFEDCDGENEIITMKTSKNVVRYNTFLNCMGSVTIRFGSETSVHGNYFFGTGASAKPTDPNYQTGGVRVYGTRHKVYNNYMEGLTGLSYRLPILIDSGDTQDSSNGDGHQRSTEVEVTHNTIVNAAGGIHVGSSHYKLQPKDNKIANNLVVGTSGTIFENLADKTNLWEGNLASATGSAKVSALLNSDQVQLANPLLANSMRNSYSMKTLSARSPAINGSKGEFGYVTIDIHGAERRGIADIGAIEFSETEFNETSKNNETSKPTYRPLTAKDVGPSAK